MTQFYVTSVKKLAGPFSSLDNARKNAIAIFKSGKYPTTIFAISKDTLNGIYGYIMDVRKEDGYPCDWAYCTANQRRYWAIEPKNGKILYPL